MNEEFKNILQVLPIGIVLMILLLLLNMYLGINFGMGISGSIIVYAIGSLLFRRKYENKTQIIRSIFFLWILTAPISYWGALAILVLIQMLDENSVPVWAVPPKDVLTNGFSSAWFLPLFINALFCFLGISIGFSLSILWSELYLCRNLPYPLQRVSANVIRAFAVGSLESKLVLKYLALGILIVCFQFALLCLGVNTISYDFTPYLLPGAAFAVLINLGLIGLGYIIPPQITVSMFIISLVTYILIAPIVAKAGFFVPGITEYENWQGMIFSITLVFGLGIFLFGDVFGMILRKIKKENQRREHGKTYETVTLIEHIRSIIQSGKKNKLAFVILVVSIFSLILLYLLLDVFGVNLAMQIILVIYLVLSAIIIDAYLLCRMEFESGITSSMHQFVLYTLPTFASGCRKYTGYVYSPGFSWTPPNVIGTLKIADFLNVDRKTTILFMILNAILSLFFSFLLFILVWYGIGYPNEVMPATNFLIIYSIYKLLVSGHLPVSPKISLQFAILLFTLGALIGGVFSFFGVSATGIALGVLLPPSMTFMFGIGGVIRIFTDYKFGKEWFQRRGQYIASGFMAGALTMFILLSILLRLL